MDAVSAVIVQRSRDAERLTPLVGWSALVHIAITLLIAIVPASWLGSVTREPENVMQISLGGAIGPRDGGLSTLGGRPVQEVTGCDVSPEQDLDAPLQLGLAGTGHGQVGGPLPGRLLQGAKEDFFDAV